MSVSTANVTPSNMELTPMRVKFNGVDLGGTLSNVVISLKYTKAEIMADQFGKSVLDRRVSAQSYQVTTELAEIKDKDIWKVVFPHARLVTSGENQAIYFDMQIGDSDLAHAAELVLHPLSLVDADLSGDFKFYKATASAESEITFAPDGQAKLKIVWNILPDTSVSPARWLFHGDTAVGLVAASASSPVFSGTGNGTMTSVAVYNGVTDTEVITAKCVTAAANGGVFFVSGSLNGALGLATLSAGTVNFVSPVISFTITDGSTDFAVNDQFTLSTVASNYA